jgi:tRNA dimethylallyltransferase
MEELTKDNKIIVILGPTASGKSDVAIKIAKKYNGEVISSDSRQVYRKMDIGSGKVTGRLRPVILSDPAKAGESKDLVFISERIPHHMIDIVSPNTEYNVAKFKKVVDKIIPNILNRGKIPIICGGTGFWIKAIVDDVNFPEVKPDWKLRNKLRNKSSEKLFEMLKKLDQARANNIDSKNKVRLIRAIEICKSIGKVPKISKNYKLKTKNYEFLQIGIKFPQEILYKRIKLRLEQRFKQGMIKEVKDLHSKYIVSWKRLESFGLEYRAIAKFLQNKTSKDEMKEELFSEIKKYSKRQLTWFKRDKRIQWLNEYKDIEKTVQYFLN